MRKFFVNFAVLVMVVASHACATAGFPLAIPGYEAAAVVAGNQAMVATIGGWGPYGMPGWTPVGQFGAVPVCRLQDLQGLPPVSQPVVVRVDKTRGHRTADIVGGAVVGTGLGGLTAGKTGAAYGAAAGAGGGVLVSNHEYDLCLYLPAPPPAPLTPPTPPPPTPAPVPPMPPTPPPVLLPTVTETPPLAGVSFTSINETKSVVVITYQFGGRERRVALKPGARAEGIPSARPRIFLVLPVGDGSYGEYELDLRSVEDATLPGWRIRSGLKLKSP